ncbi:hypothetical protein METBIDRAFT_33497 [Metschnikowia bicuspidata var. bicuspidata NRRL YB-4993]|uniref:Elongator complex protein 5 n=1 Tax=Metschnikowia bicuspidata var. bicuspidata NRRL YB-4993 TaxID=869754 RepID=A0A1A0H5J2_9ASCO|nr:hypothetical protein METBIDRAFT_33497 [Metschnikowia bicuspidata var. bicuspidata NRRL YB-4993]OBA19311.1 hypothetical protein METBIDRAFT_33497 [Metschnikowia bicuspidata var. bicuspidata NRRL YB-4993]
MSHPSLVLLNRHLALKENSPFTLVIDSLAQSAHHLLREFVHRCNGSVIYLSFETTVKPKYATSFMDCSRANLKQIQEFLHTEASTKTPSSKSLIIIDSLNYLEDETHALFVSGIVHQSYSVVACYHINVPTVESSGYPQPIKLLSYIALSIFEIEPLQVRDLEELDSKISKFQFPANLGLNLTKFRVNFTSRRKSGKSQTNSFIIDTDSHNYEIYKKTKDEDLQEDEELLKDLTTFNLTTNSKQKLAREQVELPFMEAQTELGKFGGAIVYEFEKDDDYDEEDPYEDPF